VKIIKNFNQRGTALISALLITAIAALLATTTLLSSRLLIHQTNLSVTNDQLYEYLLGANDWAKMVILNNINLKIVSSLDVTLGQAHVKAKIYAQQGLYNINNLEQPANEVNFVRLLRAVAPTMSLEKANALAQAVNAWISNQPINDEAYLQLQPPYRPAHRWLTVVSELRAVLGMDARTYQALLPNITALPVAQNSIDINYAPMAVLFTLSDKMTASQAQSIHECRDKNGFFSTVNDFLKTCGSASTNIIGGFTTEEHYYLLRATAAQGSQQLVLTSLLTRFFDVHGTQQVKIIWQQLNTD
jgi:general secretion pathway protein K